jgi:hypothetical protein
LHSKRDISKPTEGKERFKMSALDQPPSSIFHVITAARRVTVTPHPAPAAACKHHHLAAFSDGLFFFRP